MKTKSKVVKTIRKLVDDEIKLHGYDPDFIEDFEELRDEFDKQHDRLYKVVRNLDRHFAPAL